jgi:hypothetical protein
MKGKNNMHSASTIVYLARQAQTLLLLALMITLLSACGSAREQLAKNSKGTMGDVANAALTPLADVNLKRDEIPEKLKALVENPYSVPKPLKCDTVKTELSELDAILGPDMDAPRATLSANQKYAEAGAELIHDGIIGFVRSQTSIIPFRSIVRSITGAKKHEKAIAQAKEAGKLRRAYLKGLASAKFGKKCELSPIIVASVEKPDEPDSTLEVVTK